MVVAFCQKQAGVAKLGQSGGGKVQVDSSGLEVTGFEEALPHFVMGPGGIWLEFDGLVKVLDSLWILLLLSQADSQSILRRVRSALRRLLKDGKGRLQFAF